MSWGAIGGAAISTIGGALASGGGGGTPRWLRRANKDAVARAEDLSNRPYQAYTGQRVAGLSGNERRAGALARNYGDAMQPYLSGLMRSTRFNPNQLSRYENPYLDRVLEGRRRVIGEEYGRQSAALAGRQSAMDAFRTGRSDLARSRLEDSRLRALDDAESEARAEAYDRAMAAYGFTRQLGAQSNLGALSAVNQNQRDQFGALMTTGTADRSIRQAQMDFDYGQFLEGRDWDVNNFGILLDALRTAQGSSGTNQPGGPSTGGLLAGLLGTAMSNGAFDNLFASWGSGDRGGG